MSPTEQTALGMGHLCPRDMLAALLDLLETHYDATSTKGPEDTITREQLLRDNFDAVIWRKKGDIAYNSINGML